MYYLIINHYFPCVSFYFLHLYFLGMLQLLKCFTGVLSVTGRFIKENNVTGDLINKNNVPHHFRQYFRRSSFDFILLLATRAAQFFEMQPLNNRNVSENALLKSNSNNNRIFDIYDSLRCIYTVHTIFTELLCYRLCTFS